MKGKDCGCGQRPDGKSKSTKTMLLVEATGAEAALCDPFDSAAGTAGCAKQEPEFDSILSSFIVPLSGETTTIRVCNGSVYSVGQWLQWTSPYVTLRITGINGNDITLSNQCDNGEEVDDNPAPGQAVTNGSRFSVVGQPRCLGINGKLEEFQEALEQAEELCVPELLESSDTAVIQPVGRIESDPSNVSFKKCIRRIYGFLFRGGTPVLSALTTATEALRNNYRRLGKHKTTHDVVEIPNFSEYNAAVNNIGEQFHVGVKNTGEYLVGPAYSMCFFDDEVLVSVGDFDPYIAVTSGSREYTSNINFAGVTKIQNVVKNQNHFYACLHIMVMAGNSSSREKFKVSIDDQVYMMMAGDPDGSSSPTTYFHSLYMPFKITNINTPLVLKVYNLQRDEAFPVVLKVTLKGIYA